MRKKEHTNSVLEFKGDRDCLLLSVTAAPHDDQSRQNDDDDDDEDGKGNTGNGGVAFVLF